MLKIVRALAIAIINFFMSFKFVRSIVAAKIVKKVRHNVELYINHFKASTESDKTRVNVSVEFVIPNEDLEQLLKDLDLI